MTNNSSERCAFCEIIAGRIPATIVAEEADALALVDLRQFHPGHILVIPRRHLHDIREADDSVAAALMQMIARVTRAVADSFPNEGFSIWHSIGEGANQEVPHLHFHIHPRHVGDDLLRIYPHSPATPDRATLEAWGANVARALAENTRHTRQ